MGYSVCKTCGGEFSNTGFLVDHWNRIHKPKFCMRCGSEKIRPSSEPFCTSCAETVTDPKLVTRIDCLDRAILRSAERFIRWENRLANLLALRQTLLDQRKYVNGNSLQEFCGHGLPRGRCVPCNPIFKEMTTEGFKKAESFFNARIDIDAKSLREKLERKKRAEKIAAETIEVELD